MRGLKWRLNNKTVTGALYKSMNEQNLYGSQASWNLGLRFKDLFACFNACYLFVCLFHSVFLSLLVCFFFLCFLFLRFFVAGCCCGVIVFVSFRYSLSVFHLSPPPLPTINLDWRHCLGWPWMTLSYRVRSEPGWDEWPWMTLNGLDMACQVWALMTFNNLRVAC